jgi:hypothetical protein
MSRPALPRRSRRQHATSPATGRRLTQLRWSAPSPPARSRESAPASAVWARGVDALTGERPIATRGDMRSRASTRGRSESSIRRHRPATYSRRRCLALRLLTAVGPDRVSRDLPRVRSGDSSPDVQSARAASGCQSVICRRPWEGCADAAHVSLATVTRGSCAWLAVRHSRRGLAAAGDDSLREPAPYQALLRAPVRNPRSFRARRRQRIQRDHAAGITIRRHGTF